MKERKIKTDAEKTACREEEKISWGGGTRLTENKAAAKGKRNTFILFSVTILTALLFLAVCSMNSFFYPLNDWMDVNCYYTVGRGMFRGLVPYRDLYEQKGPLLYFLYGLADFVFPHSYLGAWFLEVVSATWFLILLYKTVNIFAGKTPVWLIPLFAFAVYGSYAFSKGGSAEELCLPLFAAPVSTALKYFYHKERFGRMPYRTVALQGVFAGCVLWIKFTWLGLYAAWAAVAAAYYIKNKKGRELFLSAGVFIGGMLLATLPWLLYFGLNGAIGDWLKVYLYDNIFVYAGRDSVGFMQGVGRRLNALFRDIFHNIFFYGPVLAGIVACTVRRKGYGLSGWFVAAMWSMFGALAFGVYCGNKVYQYYCLPLAAFLPLFSLPVLSCIRRLQRAASVPAEQGGAGDGGKEKNALKPAFARLLSLVLAAVLGIAGCFATGCNVFALGSPKENYPQEVFARLIRSESDRSGEAPTLLNYAALDGGFYRAAKIEPNSRYFARLNIMRQEMEEIQFSFIAEHGVRYVVTSEDRARERMKELPEYELIAEMTYFPGEVYYHITTRTWTLYRLSYEYRVE